MAEEKADDTSRNDAPEPGQRRRRAFAPAEPAGPDPAPIATPSEAEKPPQPAPAGMRRRRFVEGDAIQSAPATASAATPAAEPARPPQSEPAPAAASPSESAPSATDASAGARGKKPEAQADSVSPARRAVRVILLLVLMVAMAGMFYLLIEDLDRRDGGGVREDIPDFRPFAADSAGDELAASLAAQIAGGRYDMVLAKRDEYLSHTPRHPQVLGNVYLAEAVGLTRDSYNALSAMPEVDTDDGSFLAVEERLRRLLPRMAILNRMTELRNDWENALLDVPGIREIFDATGEETFLANRRVTDWRRYRAAFEDAFTMLNAAFPDYEAIAARLQALDQVLPNNGVARTCRNLQSLLEARNSVAANDMRSANDALSKMEIRDYPRPPEAIEDRFESVIEAHRDQIVGQFASWRRLWDESEKASAFYNRGEMERAVRELTAVLAHATPDSSASQALYDDLTSRNRHWSAIQAAYTEALRQDNAGSIPDRMRAWQAFALLLDAEGDPWQSDQALAGAQRIKNEFNANLEKFNDEYAGAWGEYKSITAQQRQPSSPRENFAGPAADLRRLALAAEDALRARTLAQSLELTEKSRQAISMARQILAEQGGQAQSLWNLGRLYRDRGEIALFRECLERIVLLGENPGNPFYSEARTLLSEGGSNG